MDEHDRRPAVDVDRGEQGREVHVEEPADRRRRRVRDEQTDLAVADGVPHRVEQTLGRLTEVDDGSRDLHRVRSRSQLARDRVQCRLVVIEDHEVDPRRGDLAAVLGAQAARSAGHQGARPVPARERGAIDRRQLGVVVRHRRTVPVSR